VQVSLDTKDRERYLGKPASFRVLGDGKYLKVYVDKKRLTNVPNAAFKRDKALLLKLQGRDDDKDAVLVTRIRVAEGASRSPGGNQDHTDNVGTAGANLKLRHYPIHGVARSAGGAVRFWSSEVPDPSHRFGDHLSFTSIYTAECLTTVGIASSNQPSTTSLTET